RGARRAARRAARGRARRVAARLRRRGAVGADGRVGAATTLSLRREPGADVRRAGDVELAGREALAHDHADDFVVLVENRAAGLEGLALAEGGEVRVREADDLLERLRELHHLRAVAAEAGARRAV